MPRALRSNSGTSPISNSSRRMRREIADWVVFIPVQPARVARDSAATMRRNG